METGTVTAFNAEGFGFIAPDRHAGEIWMRPRSVDGGEQLYEGQRVEYVVSLSPAVSEDRPGSSR
jgi:cold shock CspA family protein